MSLLDLFSWKEILLSLYRKLVVKRDGGTRDRLVILVLSVVLSFASYFALIDLLATDRNLIRRLARSLLEGDHYIFQAGQKDGTYFKMGGFLRDAHKLSIEIEDNPGSQEILEKVLKGTNNIGIVQEDHLARYQLSSNRIRRIASLYQERLHVLYLRSRWEEIATANTTDGPSIRLNPGEETKKFFRDAKVRFQTSRKVGKPVPFQFHLLKVCGLSFGEEVYEGLTDAIRELKDGNIHVVFYTAGAPNPTVQQVLNDTNAGIQMIEVYPDAVMKLNEATRGTYLVSAFTNIYGKEYDKMSTVATDAVLIAPRGVPEPDVRSLLESVTWARDKLTTDSGERHHPLRDYEITDVVAGEYADPLRDKFETFGLFAAIFLVLMVVWSRLLAWITSSWKMVLYTRDITSIYRDSLPNTSALEQAGAGGLSTPMIDGEAIVWAERLVQGISKLLKLAMMIRDDYDSGGMTLAHHSSLIDTLYSIKRTLQEHLVCRLRDASEDGVSIQRADLRKLHTANYLSYVSLRELHGGLAQPIGTDAAR